MGGGLEIDKVFMKILRKKQQIESLTDEQLIKQFYHMNDLLKINLVGAKRMPILAGLVHGWLDIRLEIAKRKQSTTIQKHREGIVKCKLNYSQVRDFPEVAMVVNNFLIRFGNTHEGDLVRRLIKAPEARIPPTKKRRQLKSPRHKRPRGPR